MGRRAHAENQSALIGLNGAASRQTARALAGSAATPISPMSFLQGLQGDEASGKLDGCRWAVSPTASVQLGGT